ncbi:MAG: tetratricopeptide repeat protein [Gemmatimonadota bacterium]|nr:tetratricopeptide repeat protein [Gemmatimonadota bacterium]MDH4347710.1 tetratricopeptide repeat protein [Gemmatimonadota bacterium]MDH5282655.1 tetratricopeptide repeat protein [Gemmatimonadota bacterium]
MRIAVAYTVLALCGASVSTAQTLGRVDFPNSGNPAAQPAFLKGVLLLHSFEYEDAAVAFREAQAADPGFAMAYWGEALTHTHPLWNQQNQKEALAVLARLAPDAASRRARAGTERERLYLDAIESLYGDGAKAKRDTLFSAALERITRAHPDDQEARAFHALWLMGLSQGNRNVPAYMRAGAIADEIYRRNPEHPGALHYIIHAFDDPVHAPLGLRAAREYSVIAAGADHAQHMTTHIFLALGMWDETVAQNAVAAGPDSAGWRPGHYTAWLGYGLLQQGKYRDARRHLERVRGNLPTPARLGPQAYMLGMRAHYLAGTEAWDDGVADWALDTTISPVGPKAMDAYAVGVAHLRRGRQADANASLARLERYAARAEGDNAYGASPALAAILLLHFKAELALAARTPEEALRLLSQAAGWADTLPAEFGPPDIVKPAHERRGEILLELGRAAEAQREFTHALALAPGRSRSLWGLGQAALKAGDSAAAERAFAQLRENWKQGDSALPAIPEVHGAR